MKKLALAVFTLGLMLTTVSAYAQDVPVIANIPFDFTVNGKTLPAGEYIVSPVGTSSNVLSIRSYDQKVAMLAMPIRCQSSEASEKTKLVFNHRGNRYFLNQVWVRGYNAGREFSQGTLESEMALDYPAEKVILVAQSR
jgi:hypothetical protein